MNKCKGERAQVVPLLTVVIVLAGLVCLAAGRLGGAAVARAKAVTAADAAALAGAAAGRQAAARAASANGGRMARYEQLGDDTRVRVELGGAHATARARRSGGPGRSAGGGPAAAWAPALRAALSRAAQLLGAPVPVVAPVAGGSHPGDAAARHARGLAADVRSSGVAAVLAVASQAGLCQPYPHTHPEHFELCPPRRP